MSVGSRYVRRIAICSKRFQCLRFKKTIKAKMGVSAVKKKRAFGNMTDPQLHCVISSFGVLPAVILTFIFVRKARTAVTLCCLSAALLFIVSFLPLPTALFFGGGGAFHSLSPPPWHDVLL